MSNFNFYAETVRQSVGMKEILGLYNLTPNRSGFICCPIHHEKTPSCKIYPDGKGWWCYGCNSGGSIIDFVMGVHKCGFTQAIKIINSEFCLGLFDNKPNLRKVNEFRRRQARENSENKEIERLTALFNQKYRKLFCELNNHNKALPYSEREIEIISKLEYWDYLADEISNMERGEKLSLLRSLMKDL